MLLSLHIENIAVIKCVDIDFDRGLTVLTGETGAGKSIIIDSLNFLMGNRTTRDIIRAGESRAFVSALFADLSDSVRAALAGMDIHPDEDGALLLQRSMTEDGRTQSKINGRAITAALQRDLARFLINIHGQNDNQQLLQKSNHTALLDAYAKCQTLRAEYECIYDKMTELQDQITKLSLNDAESARLAEILRFQIADIGAANLKIGEEEKLEAERAKIQNAERIARQAGFAYKALRGSEKGSVVVLLDRCTQALNAISDVIPEAAEMASKLLDYRYEIDDMAETVYAYLGDPEEDMVTRLNKIEARLDAIYKLKRKYGHTIEEILAFKAGAEERLGKLENSEALIEQLKRELAELRAQAAEAAARLTAARQAAAERLAVEVCEVLRFLDMPKVVFEVSVRPYHEADGSLKFTKSGVDDVEFLVSANPGMPPDSLAKIASGGELARIMLALKSVLAESDGVGTLIFDEIDTGVSGRTAQKIGIKLKSIAESTQVLCVTHSAQIAALAHHHALIEKTEQDGRSVTSVRYLDKEGRVAEVARILGGIHITDAQRRAAFEMVEEFAN